MALIRHIVVVILLCTSCVNKAEAATCNDQFETNVLAHDNQLDYIYKKQYTRNDEKLAEKCGALALLVTRLVQSGCQLTAAQFAQLGQRQRNLLATGMTSCWAARPFRPTVPGQTSTSAPIVAPSVNGASSLTASPFSLQAVGNTNIYDNLNKCDMKVRNCYLQFQVNLMMRSGFRSQTCTIIEAYTNCLLALPDCGFSELFRPLILRGAVAQTEFRYWESKECPASNQKTSTEKVVTVSPVVVTTTQQTVTAKPSQGKPIAPVKYEPDLCGRAKFRCGSGNCVTLANICDGVDNCGDGSDEIGCQRGEKSIALQIDQIFVKNECYDVMSNCTSIFITPLLHQVQIGLQPDPEKLCKASNNVFQCALYDSCPTLTSQDRTQISALLVKSFEQLVSKRTCQLISQISQTSATTVAPNNTSTSAIKATNLPVNLNTNKGTTTTTSVINRNTTASPKFYTTNKSISSNKPVANPRCISSCQGIRSGNYHSCAGCQFFATCVEGFIYDKRPCPAALVWDDNAKKCDVGSSTCDVPKDCVSSCNGRAPGNYQSCNGCGIFVTCHNGAILDNRPCPATLVWNDITKSCEQYSPTCKTTKENLPSLKCVNNCNGLPTGQYQSCMGCSVYTICENNVFIGNMPCPNFLVWDDRLKRCEAVSSTCRSI